MEEIEIPLEEVHEHIHHAAHHSGENWISMVALSTAILAALAAVTGMLSGHYANDAMLEQIESSDKWAYYQAKGIKSIQYVTATDILKAQGVKVPQKDLDEISRYKDEQREITEKARELENESHEHISKHFYLACGVTLFQIAIAIAAISVLTRQISFWFVGLGCGVGGVCFLVFAMWIFKYEPPPEPKEKPHSKSVEKPAGEKPATENSAGEKPTAFAWRSIASTV